MNELDQVVALLSDPRTETANQTLRIGYTPDSDDVLNFYGWEQKRIPFADRPVSFQRDSIIALNRSCLVGEYEPVPDWH